MFFLRRLSLVFASFLLLGMFSCSPHKEEKKKSLPPALVVTAVSRQQDVPVELKTFGTMEASNSVTIKPMVSGEVVTVGFQEGKNVEKGALLFEIDARSYRAALAKAQASLARNRAVKDNARQDYGRYARLAQDGLVSLEQTEGYRTRAETAAADLAADQAAVENAQTQLSYCTITAPISGRLGALAVDRGNVVKANETILVTVNSLTPIRAVFTIPEQKFSLVQQRLGAGEIAVIAEVPGTTGFSEAGQVSFLDNTVDTATGTIRLKAQFDNQEMRLWPGQYVSLSLILDMKKEAVVVPVQAVQTGQKGQFVFVVTPEGTAEERSVVPGAVHEDVVVIEKGLRSEEEVVIDGHMRVIPGGKIERKVAKNPDMEGMGKKQAAMSSSSPSAPNMAPGR